MVMDCRSRWFGLEQEGFGIVFVEAAACGVAQIAGRSGGSHEAVRRRRDRLSWSAIREATTARGGDWRRCWSTTNDAPLRASGLARGRRRAFDWDTWRRLSSELAPFDHFGPPTELRLRWSEEVAWHSERQSRSLVNAAPEAVYAVVTDFANYANWVSDLKRIEVARARR